MSIHIEKRDRNKPFRAQVAISGMKRISKSFATKSAAKEWAKEMERTLNASRFSPSLMQKDRLLVDAIDIYIADVLPTKSENSQQQTLNRLNEWKRLLGTSRMIEITGTKIHHLLDKQTCQGPTKNRKLGTLSAVMTYFTKAPNQWLTSNPCHDVLRWKENDNRTRTFTDSEFEQLFEEAVIASETATWWQKSKLYLPLYLRLLRETGIRRAESRRILVRDVEWDDMFCTIKGKDIDKQTGEHIKRLTIISEELKRDLAEMVETENLGPDDFLFTGKLGRNTDFDHHFAGIRKKVGLSGPQLGFHCIRHTAITAMSRKTSDIYKLKMFSGHKTTAMLDVYVNNNRDDVKALFELR
jgi:integrase